MRSMLTQRISSFATKQTKLACSKRGEGSYRLRKTRVLTEMPSFVLTMCAVHVLETAKLSVSHLKIAPCQQSLCKSSSSDISRSRMVRNWQLESQTRQSHLFSVNANVSCNINSGIKIIVLSWSA